MCKGLRFIRTLSAHALPCRFAPIMGHKPEKTSPVSRRPALRGGTARERPGQASPFFSFFLGGTADGLPKRAGDGAKYSTGRSDTALDMVACQIGPGSVPP